MTLFGAGKRIAVVPEIYMRLQSVQAGGHAFKSKYNYLMFVRLTGG